MPPSELRVAVVGAGVVGSCIALALRKRGAAVTLLDRDEPGRGCSYGNSGAISPGSVAPLAMPGILSSVPQMLLDEESPLHLPLSYLPKAATWLMRFVASAQPSRVALSAAKLAALHTGALDRHEALARELGVPELFVRRGHLHLYPDARALAKDAAGWRMRQHYGYPFTQLDRDGILALEPHVGERYRIGMFLADHATIVNPFRYVQAMVRAFTARGGRLRREEVRAMTPLEGGRWRLATAGAADGAEDCFNHVVVAAGAWSRRLLDPLGVHLALESQRGYHVQFQGGRGTVSRTVVLADRKIFVTPMEEGLRVGGTVEIGGLERPPDPRRGAILERIARETFEGLDGLQATQWMGHRPCMPDSVPVIGPAAGRPGLWLAVGHGHLGLTDSINTAQSIASGMLGARSITP
ncbi:NAD(P)/FAD-dependent oxidoreductase [Variovorax sp. RA8]|uniref:NAD(P)/FAD-dependent oxidoreductase n=1 Tax=Variovorax sp. (strain JCM 16519 / RA8) TaxID=662548 RepID=UPI001316C36B|nr:FAD-dependent oxidoreductase [Variovorax sp. RA8]VTU26471.1 D-amino acid dehydrogenase small subunit [Variovorax sp. RA8]